jgi:uncharacterized membrane protein YeaQ/YmgE (transglycosylase-associated protein family)
MGTVLTVIIGGLIIGLLGKFVAPGDRDHIPLWLTLVCGVGGVLIGTFLYGAIWDNKNTPGFDWWRHIWQVVVAAVLVVIAAGVTGRSKARV